MDGKPMVPNDTISAKNVKTVLHNVKIWNMMIYRFQPDDS